MGSRIGWYCQVHMEVSEGVDKSLVKLNTLKLNLLHNRVWGVIYERKSQDRFRSTFGGF